MNGQECRRYFCQQFEIVTKHIYKAENYSLEVKLLNNLLKRYDKFVVLEAVDTYVKQIPPQLQSIIQFGSKKFFNSKFSYIVKLSPVLEIKRNLPFLSNREEVSKLLEEYKNYCVSDSLSSDEVWDKLNLENKIAAAANRRPLNF